MYRITYNPKNLFIYLQTMNKQEHQKFLQSIRETQEKSMRTLQSVESTLGSVRTTLTDIQETKNNIKSIQDIYSKVMDKLAHKLAMTLTFDPFKKQQGKHYDKLPVKQPMVNAVKSMMQSQCKQILFVTGAGVSTKSGIPTFRGKDGLYEKMFEFQGKQYSPEEFISMNFFKSHPEPIWKWVDEFYNLAKSAKPNQVHTLIHECLQEISKRGKHPVLVTQNIDDLHIFPSNDEYQLHRIHGTVNKMRCKNMHMVEYQKQLIAEKCKQCSESYRPHIMFFDESYGPCFGGDVKDRNFDFVVTIGTSLNTGLCTKLVAQGKTIIEINPNPVIEIGDVYQYSEDTQKTLQQMVKEIKKK